MSKQNEKHTSELSMEDLDAVAGGAANVVNSSRSNIKNNITVADPNTGTTPTTPTSTLTGPATGTTLSTNP